MSEWKVEVVRIGKVEPHENADRLEIVRVHADESGSGGYPCIIAKGTFKEGDLAVYVPVDSLVPVSNPKFAFLLPEPVRKADMSDIEWTERMRRYEREKTEKVRVKARKLRGIFSMGLLVPKDVPETVLMPDGRLSPAVGYDVAELLGIEKYEPDESNRKSRLGGALVDSDSEHCPFYFPEYTDIEGLRKWSRILEENEEVTLTEKLHGCSARYVYVPVCEYDAATWGPGGRLWVGSRHQIKKPPRLLAAEEQADYEKHLQDVRDQNETTLFWYRWFWWLFRLLGCGAEPTLRMPHPAPQEVKESTWWRVAREYELEKKLSQIPNIIVFGEIYGPVQDLKYGSPNRPLFRAFDAYHLGTQCYLDYDDFLQTMRRVGIDTVPELYRGPWSDSLWSLAEGQSTLNSANHVREGFVVRPVKERWHPRLHRVILKLVGDGYHLR